MPPPTTWRPLASNRMEPGSEQKSFSGGGAGASVVPLGIEVGMLVGSDVGMLVGSDVGMLVGSDVGVLVGSDVGVLVGSDVGASAGMLVGLVLGASMLASFRPPTRSWLQATRVVRAQTKETSPRGRPRTARRFIACGLSA